MGRIEKMEISYAKRSVCQVEVVEVDAGTSGNSESHPTLTRPEWSALRPVGVYFNWTQSMPVAAYSHHAGLSVQKTPYSAGSPVQAIRP